MVVDRLQVFFWVFRPTASLAASLASRESGGEDCVGVPVVGFWMVLVYKP